MKILHTSQFYLPSTGGAQEVVRQISERLARRGHEVTVATSAHAQRATGPINGVRVEPFDVSGSAWQGYRGEIERYQAFLADSRFDVMMNYAAQQWATDLAFPVIDRMSCKKALAPCGFSQLFDEAYAPYYRELPAALRRYDWLILHSSEYRDAQFVREQKLERWSVIPNGAGEEFDPEPMDFRAMHGIAPEEPLILTVSNHTGQKGHDAAIAAFRRLRLPRATLVIIGGTPFRWSCRRECVRAARWTRWLSFGRKRVLLLDPPRPEVVAAYRAADLFVLPSALECSPIVLFEAMASRTPFISSDCGNAAEISRWSGSGVIAPTTFDAERFSHVAPEALAKSMESLLRDPARRREMAERGYTAWKERFTWEKVTDCYERLYEDLIAGRQPSKGLMP